MASTTRWAAILAVALGLQAAALSIAHSQAATDWWRPAAGVSWQIQLNEPPKQLDLPVDVYDLDLQETPQSTIDALHARGRKVICYFSAGSYERWRPDKGAFPKKALGKPLDDWKGERWLDIRSQGVRQVMEARLDLAAAKGCDAVDPDNVDGYSNKTGFPLTGADQLAYNRFLADAAHARGLAVGLKNDVDQIPSLVDAFDFAVNEECFKYRECAKLRPFVDAGKPVFQIEYAESGESGKARKICSRANAFGFQTLIKRLGLGARRIDCRSRG